MSSDIKRMEIKSGRFSRVVIHNGIVYLTGLAGTVETSRPMTEHAEDVIRRIDHYLAMAGTDKTRILSADIYLADFSQKAEFDAVWAKWIPEGCECARTSLTCIGHSSERVEVTIVAAMPE